MTPYHDSLWSQAPASATHWGVTPHGDGVFFSGFLGPGSPEDFFTDLHERPQIYRTPEQLIAEYKKGHGAEIEADVQTFLDGLGSPPLMAHRLMKLDELLDDALFHLVLIERHLAAERARIEGQS